MVTELKANMGWVSCPKDKVTHLIDLHCSPPLKKCRHFRGEDKGKIYCAFEKETEMKCIAAYDYEQLKQKPEMVKVERIPLPPEKLEETHGGEETFPEKCPACESDSLKFFRVEDRINTGMPGCLYGELDKAYKVFYVICRECHTTGPIEKFQ
jgi:hypothetical protein